MNEIKNQERILDAIDQLRRRKARPDIQRICNFLTRRFAIDANDVKADLQRCVENEIVLKVEYKGSISYRNAARKFSHLKRDVTNDINEVDATKNFASLLTNAIAELIVEEPDYLELGVPGPELIKNILSKDSVKYTKKYIALLLQKEVDSGGLIKMENGHFSMGPSSNESEKSEEEIIQEEVKQPKISPPLKIKKKPGPKPGVKRLLGDSSRHENIDANGNGFRVGGRRKRAKKVFDPSDNNIPRMIKRRGRPAGSLNRTTIEKQVTRNDPDSSRPGSSASSFSGKDNQGGVCSVCHNHGKKANNDKMIHCRECSNKGIHSTLN